MTMNDNIMEREVLQSLLKGRFFGSRLHVFDAIDSTNRFAKMLAAEGEPEGTLVYAEAQTEGRGRWGQTWESAHGKGLWFSIILRPAVEIEKATLMTVFAATSIAVGIEKILGIEISIKWPNDLIVQNKKVGGILLEMSHRRNQLSFIVMGAGLNVCHTKEDFSPNLREFAASLEMIAGLKIDRMSLFTDILFRLEQDYQRAQKEGFDFILNEWKERNSFLNTDITFKISDRNIRGRVKEFRSNGDLLLIRPDGREETYRSNEVCEVRYADCH
jgi:BirA family biotin operon repressor/biotin-[acetyl-CoA-carboxylase] ligase